MYYKVSVKYTTVVLHSTCTAGVRSGPSHLCRSRAKLLIQLGLGVGVDWRHGEGTPSHTRQVDATLRPRPSAHHTQTSLALLVGVPIKDNLDNDNDHTRPRLMARRIVSLKGSQPQFSAVPLSKQSSASPVPIVSIHSIVSDRYTMTLGAPATQPIGFGAKPTSPPKGSNSSTDDSYLRHDTYFFEDGNITFLVRDSSLYCMRLV